MKNLSVSILFFLGIGSCFSQSIADINGPDDLDFEDINYYEIYDQFVEYVENNPDGLTESQQKRWARFNYFWYPRLQSEDAQARGSFKAYSSTIELFMSSFVCDQNNPDVPWEQLGPLQHESNDIGRVDGLYVFPDVDNYQRILIGTPCSGIWLTTNGGDTWDCVSDDVPYPGLGVTKFEADPDNSDRILAVTGLAAGQSSGYGPGPLESTDGGETWNLMTSFYYDGGQLSEDAYNRIHDIEFSPTQPGEIYAITKRQFFKSEDNGLNWYQYGDIEDVLYDVVPLIGLEVSADGSTLFCSTNREGENLAQILKSDADLID